MILLANKPTEIPVFPKKETPQEDSLLTRLLSLAPSRKEISWPQGFEGGILHRLDTPTTGGVLIAPSVQEVYRQRALFAQQERPKCYLFLSSKHVPWQEHVCEKAIAHDKHKKGKMVPKRGNNTPHRGKWYEACTSFRHIYRQDGISLWEARMQTGVMHQIRVHASFLGIALLGDRKYGGGETPDFFLGTFALHHHQIGDWPAIPVPSWWPKWAQEISWTQNSSS